MLNESVRSSLQRASGVAVWIVIFFVIFAALLLAFKFFKSSSCIDADSAPKQEPCAESPASPAHSTEHGRYVPSPVIAPPAEDHSRYQPSKLRTIDWFQFEKLVALAYSGTGIVTRKGGANPDGGIDLIVERHGERIGVQCKHWKSWTVGVKVVREMIGALADAGLKGGVIVSLNPYSQDAIDLAGRHNIELVDEQGVVELIKYLDQQEVQAILCDTKKICPKCEREMVKRTATKGKFAGATFWGCSGYPSCTFIME